MSKLTYTSSSADSASSQEEQMVQEAQLVSANRSTTLLNRRRMLAGLGLAAGATTLGLTGCSDAGTPAVASPAGSGTPTVLDVLNFALNLEYFEAAYYTYVVTGSGLPASMMGSAPGTVTGGAKVTFKYSSIANIAANLMQEEMEHVTFLQQAITSAGGTPVSMPSLNLQPAPAYAVTDDATFVSISRTLEAVGVSAYEGAAGYLTSVPQVLTYAASIHDLEAQHEGSLRQACVFFPSGTAVTSPAADSMDIPPTLSTIFNTNPSTGLNTVRTISQVLQIVYATPGVTGSTKGGFFPNGFNGNIYIS